MEVFSMVAKGKNMDRRTLLELAGGFAAAGMASVAGCTTSSSSGSDYPSEAITLWIPYSKGGGIDMSTRALQPYLEDELEVSLAAKQVTGGGGAVAYERLATNVEADGYTVSVAVPSFMYLMDKVHGFEYDPPNQRLIYQWASDPFVLSVNADSDWQTLDDVIEASKEEPLKWGQVGLGGSDHYAMLRLTEETEFDGRPVSFSGGGASSAALMGGRIDIDTPTLSTAWPRVESGDIRPIAITAPPRSEFEPLKGVYPDTPTVPKAVESVSEPIKAGTDRALIVPPDLPDEKIQVLTEAFEQATANEEWQSKATSRHELIDRRGPEEAMQNYRTLINQYESTVPALKESVEKYQN